MLPRLTIAFMSKHSYLSFRSFRLLLALVSVTILQVSTAFAEPDAAKGKELFKANCARCHYPTDQKFTGPGLAGVRDRWGDEANLIAWIRNSSEFLKTGHKYANDLYVEYGKQQMPAFNISDEEILSILAYIDNPGGGDNAQGGGDVLVDNKDGKKEKNNTTLIIVLVSSAIILLILARALSGVGRALENVSREKKGEDQIPEPKQFDFFINIRNWMASHKKITTVIVLIIFGWLAYEGFLALNTIGIYKGYKPKQPIEFSHKIHVKQNGIQCQYCHSGAEKSRHANIPSANVCMNCHKAVNVGTVTGKKEIAKIYASIGWNPVDLKYWDNYENVSPDEVKQVFAAYLEDTKGAYGEVEKHIQKPVEWIQIHNLPDHAFFSHQQHVVVGKVECQECHGKVEEMDVVEQHAKLTMGWCINCHRKTEVKYADNKYYERLHDYYKEHLGEYEMKKGQAFTVEKIGGLECSKCHY